MRDPSHVRPDAQSRVQIESTPARAEPLIPGRVFSPTTVLRPAALQWKRTRSLAAYASGQLTARRDALIHKPMQVTTERHATCPLGGWVQLHDAYWNWLGRGGKRGRPALGKTPFLTAVKLHHTGPQVKMLLIPVRLTREQ